MLASMLALVVWVALPGHAQVVGEEAELDRLSAKAEEALANEDAEGAAMSAGRAALMAAQLSKRHPEGSTRQLWQATEHLYRSQEHGYRAMALFRRAGGELPASAGVCGSLQLANLELRHAQDRLTSPSLADTEQPLPPRLQPLRQTVEDWSIFLDSMQADFRCSS